MDPEQPVPLRMTVYSALFAALTAVGAYMALPIGPVPVVMQNLFVFLAGLILGGRWGLASVGIYLLAGAVGLPVFAGGTGGIGRFLGPTGGFLIGYLPAVFLIGWIAKNTGQRPVGDILAMLCGTTVLYACGLIWLKLLTGLPWPKAFAVGMLPFLPGDALENRCRCSHRPCPAPGDPRRGTKPAPFTSRLEGEELRQES